MVNNWLRRSGTLVPPNSVGLFGTHGIYSIGSITRNNVELRDRVHGRCLIITKFIRGLVCLFLYIGSVGG